jgi:hypothetical protein
MTVLVFDAVEDRRFETGIERGVLYPFEGGAFPWNGLTAITEMKTREVKSYYMDGVKYLDHHVPGSYAAKLQAFTYPDELEEILGTSQFAPGVFLHDQRPGMFHLAYRTKVGDASGKTDDYKLHLAYNLTAVPNDTTYATMGENVTPNVFEWTLSGVPQNVWGIRPTSHISLDSRLVHPTILALVEDQLYGTLLTDPVFPDLVSLLSAIEGLAA